MTDACSRADGQTDPNSPLQDRITKTFYSGPLLYQVRKGVGTNLEQAYVTYGYTPNQQRQYVIDAKGNRARMDYDGFDRQSGWVFPTKAPPASGFDPSSWSSAINSAYAVDGNDYESYGYDAAGNRTSLRRRDGSTQGFSYDALNRMVTKGGSTIADVSYGYDLAGHQLTATFATGGQGVTNAYNTRGLLTSSTTTMGGVSRAISYQYDADGNRTRVTHPDATYFSYEYDGLDRANLIRENGAAGLVAFGYDWRGQLVGMGRGTGVPTNIGFDNSGRLTSLTHDLAGTNADLTLSFGYNAASQIASRTSSNDAYAWTQHYNVSRGYQSNGQNQYSQISSSATIVPTYDGRGNLTSAGGTTYAYDGDNRLISASGATSASLAYDPLGRLFQISGGSAGTTRFLYDGDELVAEYDGSGNLLRRYVHGAGTDDPLVWYEGAGLTQPHYLHSDHQGSVIAVSGATGVAAAINSYDPWGIPSSNNLGRFQYTGQAWLPELGIYYYKARMYSPTLGRFLQTDPIGYDDQINLYAYVGNDPVNGLDITGKATIYIRPGQGYSVVQEVSKSGTGGPSVSQMATAASNLLSGQASSGQDVKVFVVEGAGSDSIKINMDSTRNDSSANAADRSYTDSIGGRTVNMDPNSGPITGAHEIGHGLGAGDQYSGGVAADGSKLSSDIPGASNIMKDLTGASANSQTADEIINAPTNHLKICPPTPTVGCD